MAKKKKEKEILDPFELMQRRKKEKKQVEKFSKDFFEMQHPQRTAIKKSVEKFLDKPIFSKGRRSRPGKAMRVSAQAGIKGFFK